MIAPRVTFTTIEVSNDPFIGCDEEGCRAAFMSYEVEEYARHLVARHGLSHSDAWGIATHQVRLDAAQEARA